MGREKRRLESNSQLGFGFEPPASRAQVAKAPQAERFQNGAEGDFYIGEQRLDEYLCANQYGWVVELRTVVGDLDYSQFICRYKETARRPMHPRVLLGLIVYGITQGKWSLRDLERLARVDLGAIWVTGRLQPDHSTIAKFIRLHEQLLTEQFFTGLMNDLAGKLHLDGSTLVIERMNLAAAPGNYRMLRAEALREMS